MNEHARTPVRRASPAPGPARLLPTDPAYLRIVSPYNEAAARGRPRFVALPRTVEEVRAVVAECRAAGLRIAVHATGHDFEGRSLSGDVVIHMGGFDEVVYDPGATTLTVGGGVRVAAVNAVLSRVGRAISTGTNQDVGLVGLTLGGGAAYTSRLRGLTCDALLSAELVTFAGEALRVDDASAPEIMRLLRGGGAGGFVVTRMTFETYEAGPVTAFSATWDADASGARRLAELEARLVDAPRTIAMRVGANVAGAERRRTITLSGQVQGGNEAALAAHLGAAALDPAFAARTLPYYEAMRGALHVTSGGAFKIKSRFAFAPMGEEGLARLLERLGSWTPTGNADGAGFGLFAWGGRVRDMPGARSCMPAREAAYLASFDTSWTEAEGPDEIAAQLGFVSALDAIAADRLSDLAYVNFPDSDEGAYERRHLGPIAADLAALRARFDPDGLFRPASRCWHVRPGAAPDPSARAASAIP